MTDCDLKDTVDEIIQCLKERVIMAESRCDSIEEDYQLQLSQATTTCQAVYDDLVDLIQNNSTD